MFKVLKKYTKGLRIFILFIVAFLYIQAQCELALPDYMSNIVTYGIQSGGFDDAVPEIMSKETMDNTLIFTQDDDYILDNYQYIAVEDINEDNLPYSINKNKVKDSGVYVLKDISSTTHNKIEKAFGDSIMIESSLRSMADGESSFSSSSDSSQAQELEEMMKNLPAGMNIFDAIKMMPQENIDQMVNKFDEQLTSYGDSTLDMIVAKSIQNNYQELGIDTGQIQVDYILSVGLTMLVVALSGTICAILVGYCASLIAAQVSRRMRKDVFESVESFSTAELDHFSTASLITRSTNDIQQVQMATVMMLRIVIYSPILAIGAIIRVLNSANSMIWIIALVVVIIMAIISVLMIVVGPKFKMMQSLVDRLNLVMREALSGMLVIRAFHNEREEEERFEIANQNITKTQLFTSRTMALMMPVIMFIMNLATLLIVWIGASEVDLGTMQIGDMMAFIQYAMQIIMSFMMIAMISVFLPRASVAANRCLDVTNMKLSIKEKEEVKEFNDELKGLVEFKNVCFRYPGADEDVLKNISFTAKPGEVTAFIGSTGSGKSTIINLVPRFFDATQGEVLVDGINIKDASMKKLRDKIGLVPQKGVLFKGTIASNIKYSNPEMDDETMKKASEVACADEFILSKPETFDTEISQGGSNVSGGQKQRISIARAIAKNPEIYIFDDSFSALDFKTDAKVRDGLGQLIKENHSTMLLVGQRIASIMHANKIVVLDEGEIVGIGTHNELMKDCDVYKQIAFSQLSKEELENE